MELTRTRIRYYLNKFRIFYFTNFIIGKYDFGDGGSEFEDFLHLEEFLDMAKEEDLFVILRTGPYICSEYNFGGFPSWLLREKPMGFRTSETNYMKFVTRQVFCVYFLYYIQ